MDTGAEYDHYTADITRTFPVSGKFTPAQAEIYNLVLAAQDAAMAAIKPGGTIADVNKAAQDTIRTGLLRLGLITDAKSNQYRHWFMHGTSHWLGMNVHDVGGYQSKLEAGMIFTVEPGIYIRPDTLDLLPDTEENRKFIAAVRPAFEKYKNIGVRIEDDVLMTPDGWRNMSVALPRTIPDVEAFIERARHEMRVAGTWGVRRGGVKRLDEFVSGNFDGFSGATWNAELRDYSFTSSGKTARRGFVRVNAHRDFAVHSHKSD
jgi:Xaa-Pro aminopeptidase